MVGIDRIGWIEYALRMSGRLYGGVLACVLLGLVGCGDDGEKIDWECLLSNGTSSCSCYAAPLSWNGPNGTAGSCSNDVAYLCCYEHGSDEQKPGCSCLPTRWGIPSDCEDASLKARGRKRVSQCPPP